MAPQAAALRPCLRLVVAAAAGLAAGAAAAGAPPATCHEFPGLVIGSGQILVKNKMPTAGDCCQLCGQMRDCAAWTFHAAAGGSCYIKNNAVPSPSKKNISASTSGLHPGPACVPRQQPSMCPAGAKCPDCGGTLCPCNWSPGAGPPPPPAPKPLTPACQPPHDSYKFCDGALPIPERVADLLARIPDAVKPNLLTARGGPAGLQNLSEVGVPAYYWGTNCLHSVGAPCTPDGHCPTNFPSGPSSRRRDCHIADAPSPSLLKHLLKGEGSAAE